MIQWSFYGIPGSVVHVATVHVPDNRHLRTAGAIHPAGCIIQLFHCSHKTFIPTCSRFLLGQPPKAGQLGEHLGQLNIGLVDDLPAFKDMFPYGSRILRTQGYLRFCVVDAFLGILGNIYECIHQHDVAFRGHKRWQDSLCVLITPLFGGLAEDCENGDLFVLPSVGIADFTEKIGVYSYFMDLSAQRTRNTGQYRYNEYSVLLPVVVFSSNILIVVGEDISITTSGGYPLLFPFLILVN